MSKTNIFKRGNTLTSNEHGVKVIVTNQITPIKGQFWGVIVEATDKNVVGTINHFSKEKFTLK